MKSKVKARENRDADKIKAKGTETLALACFDPEAVLQTPHSFQSCLSYKRGLNTYNFTLYDLAPVIGIVIYGMRLHLVGVHVKLPRAYIITLSI